MVARTEFINVADLAGDVGEFASKREGLKGSFLGVRGGFECDGSSRTEVISRLGTVSQEHRTSVLYSLGATSSNISAAFSFPNGAHRVVAVSSLACLPRSHCLNRLHLR